MILLIPSRLGGYYTAYFCGTAAIYITALVRRSWLGPIVRVWSDNARRIE